MPVPLVSVLHHTRRRVRRARRRSLCPLDPVRVIGALSLGVTVLAVVYWMIGCGEPGVFCWLAIPGAGGGGT